MVWGEDMSFSSDVKEELCRQVSTARHCQIAEAAAIFRMSGRAAAGEDGGLRLSARIENPAVAKSSRSCFAEASG